MKLPTPLPLFLILGLTLAMPAMGEIYKWKDKDGKQHFSDIPPQGADVQAVRPAPPPPTSAPATKTTAAGTPDGMDGVKPAPKGAAAHKTFEERRAERLKKEAAQTTEAAAKERRALDCQRARNQRAAISSGQRVAEANEKGERVVLNAAQREAELARTQELIDAFCGD